jgi:hypothetical protein
VNIGYYLRRELRMGTTDGIEHLKFEDSGAALCGCTDGPSPTNHTFNYRWERRDTLSRPCPDCQLAYSRLCAKGDVL